VHRRCLAGAIEKSDDDHYERSDGSEYQVRWEIFPWREPNGEIGGIILFSEALTELKRTEQRLKQSLARQQSLARRLTEAQEVERRRLSTELHDRLGQNLTALGINLNIIGSKSADKTDASAVRLMDSRKLLETTIASVRDLISELRPPALDDYGLLAGLRWYGEQVRDRTGLAVAVQGSEPLPRLESRVENALFRIAQEVLTNVVKHAQASQVRLILDSDSERVKLDMFDDGCGFDIAAAQRATPRTHWGLEMIHERATAIGAHVQVESSPSQGTRVVVDFDLERRP
jgi:two-component system sensor histidine kinase UhpB